MIILLFFLLKKIIYIYIFHLQKQQKRAFDSALESIKKINEHGKKNTFLK